MYNQMSSIHYRKIVFFISLLINACFNIQLFHVEILELRYMVDKRKPPTGIPMADSYGLSAINTTPWKENQNLLVRQTRNGMAKFRSA